MNKANASGKIELKKLDVGNVRAIALVHLEAFPDSSWSKLGVEVAENYYHWQLTGPHQIVSATGAMIDNELAGFCIGGVFNGSTGGFIRKNRFLLVKKTVFRPWLLFDSTFADRLGDGMKLLKRFSATAQSPTPVVAKKPASFGILSIAVSPRYQNYGIGKKLMSVAEQAAIACGYDQMHLTVNPANHVAVKFYEKMNWQKAFTDVGWKGLMQKKQLTKTIQTKATF